MIANCIHCGSQLRCLAHEMHPTCAIGRCAQIDSLSKPETYKPPPSTHGKLQEGPPAPAVAAMEAPSRSRGEAPTGGALQVKP
jgi:hypothetical protein